MEKTINEERFGSSTAGHLINCDAAPVVPTGWKVVDHKQGGLLAWDPLKIDLYSVGPGLIHSNNLRSVIADKPSLNANVLDYLLAHPELIPSAWKGKFVFFFGTIYLGTDRRTYVRCLSWGAGRWYSSRRSLDNFWNELFPAAVAANLP